VTRRKSGGSRVTNGHAVASGGKRLKSLNAIVSNKDDIPMNSRSRIALGASAALVSFSLALAPALAQDKMGKGDGMKKEDSMSKDAMKKDDGMMKKDGMTKSSTSDGMKKDDGMKK
jgi:pentapeptide MXKDX repeat protein